MFTVREQLLIMNEKDIIQLAITRLNDQEGIKAVFTAGNHPGVDGEINLGYKDKKVKTFVEIKKELRPYQLPEILEKFKHRHPLMVVAEIIYPALKQELRNKGIAYLDIAGNIYIEQNGTIIWLEGNKPTKQEKTTTNRAFTKTGLKTVFYLLLDKDAINLTYRKLAEATATALGNIKNIIEGLREAGFVLPLDEKTLLLKNKKALLERWIAGYRETLKPTLHIGTFRFLRPEEFGNLEAIESPNQETVWGGEPAAEEMTKYLHPQIYTLYTTVPKIDLMLKAKLVPDENGNVEIYQKFWKDDIKNKYAPPLLVYADLVTTDDPRNLETAEIIYAKYLKNEFE
jgi:hypothetical protein